MKFLTIYINTKTFNRIIRKQLNILIAFLEYLEVRIQKQPSRRVLKKRCSENMRYAANFQENTYEITLWHGCNPVNLLHIFRTSFPKDTSGRLLLPIVAYWRWFSPRSCLKITFKGLLAYKPAAWRKIKIQVFSCEHHETIL